MARHLRRAELLVAIEGLALLRGLHDGSDDDAARRLTEVRTILAREHPGEDAAEPIAEAQPSIGYGAWAASYDEPDNPIVELEQPVVWELIGRAPVGRALDAACGTGRHAERLLELGHTVDGFDLTPEMLALAAVNAPGVRLRSGELSAIPLRPTPTTSSCARSRSRTSSNCPVRCAELARVLAPGGRLIVSVLHPMLVALGWYASFTGADGRRGFIREHPHRHADYLSALEAAGLRLVQMREPALAREQLAAKRRASSEIPEATATAYAGLPGVLVLVADRPRAGAGPTRASRG